VPPVLDGAGRPLGGRTGGEVRDGGEAFGVLDAVGPLEGHRDEVARLPGGPVRDAALGLRPPEVTPAAVDGIGHVRGLPLGLRLQVLRRLVGRVAEQRGAPRSQDARRQDDPGRDLEDRLHCELLFPSLPCTSSYGCGVTGRREPWRTRFTPAWAGKARGRAADDREEHRWPGSATRSWVSRQAPPSWCATPHGPRR